MNASHPEHEPSRRPSASRPSSVDDTDETAARGDAPAHGGEDPAQEPPPESSGTTPDEPVSDASVGHEGDGQDTALPSSDSKEAEDADASLDVSPVADESPEQDASGQASVERVVARQEVAGQGTAENSTEKTPGEQPREEQPSDIAEGPALESSALESSALEARVEGGAAIPPAPLSGSIPYHTTVAPEPPDAAPADASVSDASVAHVPQDHCRNCEARLTGAYCAGCGQRAEKRIVPLHKFLHEFVGDVFAFDLRIFRTVPKLLLKPGQVTKEYIQGRRKRFIPPLRLYIVASFLVFTAAALAGVGDIGAGEVFSFSPPDEASAAPIDSVGEGDTATYVVEAGGVQDTVQMSAEEREQLASAQSGLDSIRAMPTEALADSIREGLQVSLADSATNERLRTALSTGVAKTVKDPSLAVRGAIERAPYLMFILLPIFALILKLLYIRSGRVYMEHLIFSLHTFAAIYIAGAVTIFLGMTGIGWLGAIGTIVISLSPIYTFWAMWTVYEQGFLKTAIKFMLLLSIYFIINTISIVFFVLIVIMLM